MNTMNPEELLSHADFVRLLARSLVLDEQSADDIAQETWLAAVAHPPASDRSPRAWLARVVKNFSRKRHRTDSRRRAREQKAGPSMRGAAPSAAEIAAREEIRRRVVDAVQALDEPWRSTILLRYYENLPHRAVAERLGVPLETMRTRLKRGLALLRAKLDAEQGGKRETWKLALAPLAGIEGAALTLAEPAAAGGFLAATGFSAKVLSLAAAILIMGTLAVVWTLLPPSSGSEIVASDGAALATTDGNEPPSAGGIESIALGAASVADDDQPLEREALRPPSKTVVWKGTLIDYDGRPKAGVAIDPRRVKTSAAGGRPAAGSTTESGAQGAFEIGGLAPGEYSLHLSFTSTAGRRDWIEWGPIEFDAPGLIERDIVVADGLGTTVAGVVIDETTGQPMQRPPRNPEDLLDFYVGLSNPDIQGNVPMTEVDTETGTFCLRGLRPRLYHLHLIGPGLYNKLLPSFVDTEKKKIIDDIRLTVPPLGDLEILLSGFSEEEWRTIEVFFEMQWGPPLFPSLRLYSHNQTLAVPEGKGRATFKHEKLGTVARSFEIVRGENFEITLLRSDFESARPAEEAIAVTLKNSDGAPMADTLVGFQKKMRYMPGLGKSTLTGVTDSSGRVMIEKIDPGIWTAWCTNVTPEEIALLTRDKRLFSLDSELRFVTFHGIEVPESRPSDFAIDLVLPGGTIGGTLCHKETGLPLADREILSRYVAVNHPDQAYCTMGMSLATSGHRFDLAGIKAGNYQLCVAVFGFAEYLSEVFSLADGQAVDLGKILLERVGTAEIEVFDPRGTPIKFHANWEGKKGYTSMFGLDTLPLSKGRTAFGNLPFGPLSIEVAAYGFKSKTVTLDIEPHRRAKARLVLERKD